MKDFLAQLKHWRVYRLAVSYAAAAWLILQLTIAVREPLGLPTWTLTAVIGVLIAGFSVALWVGWLQDHQTVLPDGRTIPRSRRHHFAVALISLLPSVLVATVFLVMHRPARTTGSGAGAASEKSIAVLPFENLSDDKANGYFTDGVQDEILTDLSRIKALKVISRTSVMQYKVTGQRNSREIGRELGVSFLVEGSVQRIGNKVRVNAQLIDARSDAHRWAEIYDRPLDDVFAIQSEIALAITHQLQAQISPAEKLAIDTRLTANVDAYDLYLKAKKLLNDYQAQDDYGPPLYQAVRLLNAALEKDPQFAHALCLAAYAHDQLYWLELDHTTQRHQWESDAVTEALRLRPDLGEAHLARALLLYHGSADFEGARAELALASKALPNSAEVLMVTSYIDRVQGRWAEAVSNQEKALSLDPLNATLFNDLTGTYDVRRMYREEERTADAAAAAIPQQAPFFQMIKAEISLEVGQPEQCRLLLAPLSVQDDANGGMTYTRVLVALYERHFEEAARLLAAARRDRFSNLGGSLEPREWVEAMIARAAGDRARANAAMLAARTVVAAGAQGQPEDATTLALLGRIDAALGRREDALREGRRAVELRPVRENAMYGPPLESALAMIYAWTGDTDHALALLEPLSTHPAGPHYGELRLDPAWDVLRGNPRFERLVAAMEPK